VAKKLGLADYNVKHPNFGERVQLAKMFKALPHVFDYPKDFKIYTPKSAEIEKGLKSSGIEFLKGKALIPVARHGKKKWQTIRVTKNGIFKYDGKLSESIYFRDLGKSPDDILKQAERLGKNLKFNESLSFRIGHRGSSWHEFVSPADLEKYLREVVMPRFKNMSEDEFYSNVTVTRIKTGK